MKNVITSEMVMKCVVNGQFSTAELEKLVALGQQVLHEIRQDDKNVWIEGTDDLIELGGMDEDAYFDQMAELNAYRNTTRAGFAIG